jgi:thiamine pyrophosphokinase
MKKIQRVIIVVNGEISNDQWARTQAETGQYLIGVDGGTNHIFRWGMVPDLIVGDLDSIDASARAAYTDLNCPFITYPPAKDQSDLQLALEQATSMEPDHILVLGGLGKRVDHTFGNILLMIQCDTIPVTMTDEVHELQIIRQKTYFHDMSGDTLSLFSLTAKTVGVTTFGMQYPLRAETLYLGDTRGLSNEIKNPDAWVSLEEGLLLAIRVKRTLV